jgi:glucoamylase
VSIAQLPAASGSTETPGLVTITVPTKTLGTVGAGWTFTVALAGQNGEGGIDDARGYTATPGDYTFGVCSSAEAGADPEPAFCTQNPNDVPIIMDTIPPADVNVQTELNPLDNPSGVLLQGVVVPSS